MSIQVYPSDLFYMQHMSFTLHFTDFWSAFSDYSHHTLQEDYYVMYSW